MHFSTDQHQSNTSDLGYTLRLLREHRGLSLSEVARRLGLAPSSYEKWETGQARLNFERIILFALATDTDGIAIAAAIPMQCPSFAVRCADNKLMGVLFGAIHQLNGELGDDLAQLSTLQIVQGLQRICRDLAAQLKRSDVFKDAWDQSNGFGQLTKGSLADELARRLQKAPPRARLGRLKSAAAPRRAGGTERSRPQ